MGERELYQPLTQHDKVTVVLYRVGIALATLIIAAAAYMSVTGPLLQGLVSANSLATVLILALYGAVGLSVFFIHLYVNKFHRTLKNLYYLSIAALALLFILGKGDIFGVLISRAYGPLLLLPLAGCLGFITAKEAFCFRLTEGYLIALLLPLYLLVIALGTMTARSASYGLVFIAALLVIFSLRKVFMPLHYDIGDKSAYT
ncbi:MAG: DUF2301 domain-containing membrane protein [Nitrospirota bacterium]